jgi:hypothetical protein
MNGMPVRGWGFGEGRAPVLSMLALALRGQMFENLLTARGHGYSGVTIMMGGS